VNTLSSVSIIFEVRTPHNRRKLNVSPFSTPSRSNEMLIVGNWLDCQTGGGWT